MSLIPTIWWVLVSTEFSELPCFVIYMQSRKCGRAVYYCIAISMLCWVAVRLGLPCPLSLFVNYVCTHLAFISWVKINYEVVDERDI